MHKQEGYKNIAKITGDCLFIIFGVIIAGFGLKGFLIPNNFIDGGVTGISLLIALLTGTSLSLLIFLINIPFIVIAKKQIGNVFALKTFLAISGLSLCLILIEYPVITSDKLLVAVFGGFFLGAGIGLSVRGGSVIDGTEVLALYIKKKLGMTIGDVILIINIIIFSFAAVLLSMETALYSILTYLSASKTVDFIVQGIEEYIGVTIISDKNREIRKMLINKFGKGVTIYKGQRGYKEKSKQNEIDILFTVITRLDLSRIKNEILSIDKAAFITEHSINNTKGGTIKSSRNISILEESNR